MMVSKELPEPAPEDNLPSGLPSGINSAPLAPIDSDGSLAWGTRTSFDIASSMRPQDGRKMLPNGEWDVTSSDSSGERQFFAHQPSLLGMQEAPKPGHRISVGNAKPIFVDPAEMKARVREALFKEPYNVQALYKMDGLWQCVARSSFFEQTTLAVIAINALWIAVDTDNNEADVLLQAHPLFQAMENFFCAFFSFEWTVRFLAFRKKKFCLRDAWFVFDSVLVFMMVLETWLMSVMMLAMNTSGGGAMGNASVLRIARLLRLSRMARMARLLRVMPELMIMIKGMLAAIRSVFFTLLLLVIIMYVFGIAFTQLLAGSSVGERYYSSVPHSMYTLLLYGTLLDDIGTLTKDMGRENMVVTGLFLLFVLLGALTVMNMLIGVLCEVVSAVAATENEEMLVTWVRSKIEKVVEEIDTDGDNMVSKAEFNLILENPGACRALQDVGVDVVGLVDFADVIFEEDELVGGEKELTFTDFMDIVLQLRGSNVATVKDVVDLRKQFHKGVKEVREAVAQVGKEIVQKNKANLSKRLHRAASQLERKSDPSRSSRQQPYGSSEISFSQESILKDAMPEIEWEAPKNPEFSESARLDFLAGLGVQLQLEDAIWEPLHDKINANSHREKIEGDLQSDCENASATGNPNRKSSDIDLPHKGKSNGVLLSSHGHSHHNGTLPFLCNDMKSIVLDVDANDVNSQLSRLDEALNRLVHIRKNLGVCAWPIDAHKARIVSSSL